MDTARPYNTLAGMLAAVIGAALFSLVFWATSEGGPAPVQWPEVLSPPTQMTVLFALPPCLYWMHTGRIRLPGLLWLVVGMTLVHWLAMSETVGVAQSARADHLEGVIAGATGGAIGAVGTWLLLFLMSPGFRTRRAAAIMAVATVLLAAVAAYAIGFDSPARLASFLSGHPIDTPLQDPPVWGATPGDDDYLSPISLVWNLYLPWQLVYGAALAMLFKDK